MSHIDSLRQNT